MAETMPPRLPCPQPRRSFLKYCSLTDGVRAQIEPALVLACGVLTDRGVDFTRRDRPPARGNMIGPDALDIDEHEQGHPVLNRGAR